MISRFRCKSICLCLVNLFIFINLQQANAINLSSNAKVSLLTCSAGKELYSTFGHSALRVYDDSLKIDIVFNYGTFSFNTPNFYLKFANGDLNYKLSCAPFGAFLDSYKYEQRSVVESRLALTETERNRLWERLLENYKPENRYYRYDFFFDNCATRIRDIVFEIKEIDRADVDKGGELTFRDYLHQCMGTTGWTSQGIDLLLGAGTDDIASDYDRAYLPAYLDSLFHSVGIVESTHVLHSVPAVSHTDEPLFTTPLFATLSLLGIAIALSVAEIKKRLYFKWFDVAIFGIMFLLSLLLWYLWLFTKHAVTAYNINVLLASVLYLPMIVLLVKNSRGYLLKGLSAINCLLLIMFILLSIVGVQNPPYMTFPLLALLLLRNILIIRRNETLG